MQTPLAIRWRSWHPGRAVSEWALTLARLGPGQRRKRHGGLDVTLHIGAHRTGTTTLQRYLLKNRNKLDTIHTAVWGPNRTRKGLFAGLTAHPDEVSAEARDQAQRSTRLIRIEMASLSRQGCKKLIVSEENMIGGPRGNLRLRRLYPEAGQRLVRFAPAFGKGCGRICLSIRSYESYWASVLAYAVNGGGPMPDADVLDRLVTQPLRWRDLVGAVSRAFPGVPLVVWPFESFVGQPEQQLSMLLGEKMTISTRHKRIWSNASPSLADLRQVLQDRNDRQRHLLPEGEGRWQPFQPHHIAALRAQYNQDLAWLRAGADGLATYIESAGEHPRKMTEEEGNSDDQQRGSLGQTG